MKSLVDVLTAVIAGIAGFSVLIGIKNLLEGIGVNNAHQTRTGSTQIVSGILLVVAAGILLKYMPQETSPTSITYSINGIFTTIVDTIKSGADKIQPAYNIGKQAMYYFLIGVVGISFLIIYLGTYIISTIYNVIFFSTSPIISTTLQGSFQLIGMTLMFYYGIISLSQIYRKIHMESIPESLPISYIMRTLMSAILIQGAYPIAESLGRIGFSGLDTAMNSVLSIDSVTSIMNQIIDPVVASINEQTGFLVALLVSIIALIGFIGIAQSLTSIIGDMVGVIVKVMYLIIISPIGFANFASDETFSQGINFAKNLLVTGIQSVLIIIIPSVLAGTIITNTLTSLLNVVSGAKSIFLSYMLYMVVINIPVAIVAGTVRLIKEIGGHLT